MGNIIWFSRHAMSKGQLDDLHRIYGGDVEVKQIDLTINDVSSIVNEIDSETVAIAAVLPTKLLADLKSATDVSVIVSESLRVRDDETGEFVFSHKHWKEVMCCTYREEIL